MTVKRRNHGRNKHGGRQACPLCVPRKAIPKDKAIKRFIVTQHCGCLLSSLISREASARIPAPKLYLKMYYCAAVHQRIVRVDVVREQRRVEPSSAFRAQINNEQSKNKNNRLSFCKRRAFLYLDGWMMIAAFLITQFCTSSNCVFSEVRLFFGDELTWSGVLRFERTSCSVRILSFSNKFILCRPNVVVFTLYIADLHYRGFSENFSPKLSWPIVVIVKVESQGLDILQTTFVACTVINYYCSLILVAQV
jgi:ribosomal protein S26